MQLLIYLFADGIAVIQIDDVPSIAGDGKPTIAQKVRLKSLCYASYSIKLTELKLNLQQ